MKELQKNKMMRNILTLLFVFFRISGCFYLSEYRNAVQSRKDILRMGTGNVFGKLFRIATFLANRMVEGLVL